MQIFGMVYIRYQDGDFRSAPAWYCMYKKQLNVISSELPEKPKHHTAFSVRLNDSNTNFDFDFKTGRFDPIVEAKLHKALYDRMAVLLEARENGETPR